MMSSSASPAALPSKPDPRISVKLPKGEHEVFMSFALLNEIASLAGGPEGIPRLSFDPATSTAAMELMLAPRDKRGRIIDPSPEEDPIIPVDLDPEIAEQLLDWAGAHALDFFIRRFRKSTVLMAGQAGQLAEVGSSLTSLATSVGKTA